MKDFRLKAVRLRDFDSAQICVGGVKLSEIDPQTLECRSEDLKGIYLAGELIDVDGPCGGYNLQWAWSSGYVAGKHAS
jgi:predicted flavoprotein YhiN